MILIKITIFNSKWNNHPWSF